MSNVTIVADWSTYGVVTGNVTLWPPSGAPIVVAITNSAVSATIPVNTSGEAEICRVSFSEMTIGGRQAFPVRRQAFAVPADAATIDLMTASPPPIPVARSVAGYVGGPVVQYATAADVEAAVDAKLAGVVGGAPALLDTLKELADALGDDANFATTVMNSLATKVAILTAGAVITASTSPTMSQVNRYNASSGALAPSLPALSGISAGQQVVLEKDGLDTTRNTITFTAAGSDTFDDTATTVVLREPGEKRTLQVVSISGTKYWKVLAGLNTITANDRRYGFGDVFNWKASNTRRLQRSLGAARAGTGFCDQLFIGDSETSSYTGTTTFDSMWPRIMRDIFPARGVPLGGTGWVFDNALSTPPADSRWTIPGSWVPGALGFLGAVTAALPLTFASDIPGTAISVAYFNSATGQFTVSVDGGTPVTVTPTGASTVGVYTVTGLPNTTHTIVITTASSTVVQIIGVQCYGTSGVRLHNAALAGSKAKADWADGAATYQTRAMVVKSLFTDPDVIHIALGVNDLTNGVASSDVITALTSIRNWYPNADAILYAQYQPSTTSTWAAYVQALYALAVTLDCPLVDLYQRSGGYTVANANGMMAADHVHPLPAAQADWGLLATNLQLKGM